MPWGLLLTLCCPQTIVNSVTATLVIPTTIVQTSVATSVATSVSSVSFTATQSAPPVTLIATSTLPASTVTVTAAAPQPSCVPSGARAAFNTLAARNTTGCSTTGNPCAQIVYADVGSSIQTFQAYGQSLTCSSSVGMQCISYIGLTTSTASTSTCQGAWDVYCDSTKVGTINTIGKACGMYSIGSSCAVNFAARSCSAISVTAAPDGDNTMGCCKGASSPDSKITGISAW